jgi:hypothetical protein
MLQYTLDADKEAIFVDKTTQEADPRRHTQFCQRLLRHHPTLVSQPPP